MGCKVSNLLRVRVDMVGERVGRGESERSKI